MALLRYLRPIDNALDPQGPQSHSVPSVVISQVNREVKKAEMRTKKRGSACTWWKLSWLENFVTHRLTTKITKISTPRK